APRFLLVRDARQRRFEIALRIDEKIGRNDDTLAFLDCVEDFNKAITAHAELDSTRLKATFAPVDQHNLTGAAIDYCRSRYAEARRLTCADLDLHIGEHLMLDAVVGVVDIDAHLAGSGRRMGVMQDEAYLAPEGLAWERAEAQSRRSADLDEADVLLRHIGNNPDAR